MPILISPYECEFRGIVERVMALADLDGVTWHWLRISKAEHKAARSVVWIPRGGAMTDEQPQAREYGGLSTDFLGVDALRVECHITGVGASAIEGFEDAERTRRQILAAFYRVNTDLRGTSEIGQHEWRTQDEGQAGHAHGFRELVIQYFEFHQPLAKDQQEVITLDGLAADSHCELVPWWVKPWPVVMPGIAAAAPTPPEPTVVMIAANPNPGVAAAWPSPLDPTVSKAAVPVVLPGIVSNVTLALGPTVAVVPSQAVGPAGLAAVSPLPLAPAVAKAAHAVVAPGVAGVAPAPLPPLVMIEGQPVVVPDTAAVAPSPLPPSVAKADHLTVAPGSAVVEPAALAPATSKAPVPAVQPGVAAVVPAPLPPLVQLDGAVAVAPDPAAVTPSPFAPTVAKASPYVVQPGVAAVSPNVLDPTVQHAAIPGVQPDPAASIAAPLAPTVAPQAAPAVVQPGIAAVAPTPLAPTVAPQVAGAPLPNDPSIFGADVIAGWIFSEDHITLSAGDITACENYANPGTYDMDFSASPVAFDATGLDGGPCADFTSGGQTIVNIAVPDTQAMAQFTVFHPGASNSSIGELLNASLVRFAYTFYKSGTTNMRMIYTTGTGPSSPSVNTSFPHAIETYVDPSRAVIVDDGSVATTGDVGNGDDMAQFQFRPGDRIAEVTLVAGPAQADGDAWLANRVSALYPSVPLP